MGSEKMRKCFESFIAGGLVFVAGAACAGVELRQTVMLEEGWNSVSLQIGIAEDVNDVFRDWPVEWVALYDPAAFLDTKQYSAGRTRNVGGEMSGERSNLSAVWTYSV